VKHKSSSVFIAGWAVAQSGSESRTRKHWSKWWQQTERERDM